MKTFLPRAAAVLSFGLAAPLLAGAALADTPAQDASEAQAKPATEQTAEAREEAPAVIEVPAITAPDSDAPRAEEAEEEKRICRRIRTDMSSRRAERVCMTRDEWREFNSGN